MMRGNTGERDGPEAEPEGKERDCWRWVDDDVGGDMMRVLVGDTADIRSSREGSGGLGMDTLGERLVGVGLAVMAQAKVNVV